ncbi:hypothetical protein ONS96_003873 [Cadophora gregata f. sp. sojae]|nr:hypothetical protein ONS96_003873 [Cadophora gregata f. sp. sojae]
MSISSQHNRQPYSPPSSIEEQFRPPPTSRDIDHLQYHISLQEFGRQVQDAANAAFPNDQRSRYSNVYVLLLCWEDEDPKLPVSIEVQELRSLFQVLYDFDVEVWKIPAESSHNELNRKILDFVSFGGDRKDDLKIVYYGGHGMLVHNRQLSWASRPDPEDPRYRSVKWNGIQHALEEAESDVLLLLDCCASGTAPGSLDGGHGHGVTELIAACGFNANANPVGPDSFTRALITELSLLSRTPSFTIATLYSRILCRFQNWMPSGREVQKAPLHVVLTRNEKLPRGIQLCPRKQQKTTKHSSSKSHAPASQAPARRIQPPRVTKRRRAAYPIREPARHSNRFSTSTSSLESIAGGPSSLQSGESSMSSVSSEPDAYPRVAITIRLQETLSQSDLSVDLFSEWLRMMPVLAQSVKVEAGFASFSTLLLVSLPVAMWCYLPANPAISVAGIIKSPNLIADVNLVTKSVLSIPTKEHSKESVQKTTPSRLGWGDDTKALLKLYKFNVSTEDEPYFQLLPSIDASSLLPSRVYLDKSQRSLLGPHTCQYPGFCFSRISKSFKTLDEVIQHYRACHTTYDPFLASSPMQVNPSQHSIGTQDSAVGMDDPSTSEPPVFYSAKSRIPDIGSLEENRLAW